MNSSHSLMPHAVCWAASPHLIWTMVAANLVTFLSYLCLCGTLLFIASRTYRVMAKDWIWFVVGFALFIVACGSTHLMEVITTWVPIFWTSAWASIITAILSAYVAIMLIRRAKPICFAVRDYAKRLASTEQENDRMRDQLLAARKIEDWGKTSATISHEIANPLQSIQDLLFLIEGDSVPGGEVNLRARQASEEAGRVIAMSQSMLSFHRESAVPESVNLCSAARSVAFLLQGIIRERQIDFRILGEGDFEIEAFPGETRQVILNLARNACEACERSGSSVILQFRTLEDGVELTLTDQGPGVDPSVAEALFAFGKSTKGEHGNGMGLWTVKQIVNKHQGWIRLDREYLGGARFRVWWPRVYSPRPVQSLAAVS